MKTKIAIHYSVEFATPFHFGSGLSSGSIDRMVRRDAKGYLVIPATTIKGVLREKVEKFIDICENYKIISEPIVQITNKDEYMNYFRWISVIDRIFGSPKYPGTLYFDDLKMSEMSQELVSVRKIGEPSPEDYLQTQQRTQTRIMRKTKTVASGALFNSEYGNPDLKFYGRIYGSLTGIKMLYFENLDVSYELFFLLSALKMTDKIGGNKSVGMGHINLNIDEIYINDKKFASTHFLSNETWEVIEARFFESDKQAYKNKGKQHEN